jgi:hypothetical protein
MTGLFIIDNYRIWAKSLEEAVKHYELILKIERHA